MDRAPVGMNHIAYLTYDTAGTVRWYNENLGMKLVSHVQENKVSVGQTEPFFHSFLAMEDGSCIAFFEVKGLEKKPDVTNGPSWVRHLSLNVVDEETLLRYKARLESNGVDVLVGPDFRSSKSIYFYDPNGIRLELQTKGPYRDPDARAKAAELALKEWEAAKVGANSSPP